MSRQRHHLLPLVLAPLRAGSWPRDDSASGSVHGSCVAGTMLPSTHSYKLLLLLCFLPSLLLCTLKIIVFFLFELLLTPVPHRPWGWCTSPSRLARPRSLTCNRPLRLLCGWMMSLSHWSPDFDFKHEGREWVACGCSPAPQKTRLTPTQRMQFPPEEFTLCDLPALCFSVSPPDQRVYIPAHTFPGPLETKRTGFSMVLSLPSLPLPVCLICLVHKITHLKFMVLLLH